MLSIFLGLFHIIQSSAQANQIPGNQSGVDLVSERGNVSVVTKFQLLDTIHFKLCSVFWKNELPMKGTTLLVQPSNPAFPYTPLLFSLDSTQSCADITLPLSDYLPGTTFSYTVLMPDSNYLNGVNLLDLCLISKHILGIEPLASPYALIAADANLSGSITTFDIVEFRKLIMGIYTELPNNNSWQFFADYCSFPNPANPFQGCASGIDLDQLAALDGDTAKIIGVKIGDVDGNASLNGAPFVSSGATDSLTIILPQGLLSAGAPISVPVKLDKDFNFGSLQISFHIDPALALYDSITDGALNISPANASYNNLTGKLSFINLGAIFQGIQVPAGVPLFYIHLSPFVSTELTDALKVLPDTPDNRTYALGNDCGSYYKVGAAYAGFVSTNTPLSTGINLFVPYPNPFSDHCFLEIELASSESAMLEVYDLTGRIVFSEEKNLATGTSRWEIPASVVPPGSLGIWRLRIGDQMATGKIAHK